MSSVNVWIKVAGLYGASAVALGAFGAHGLRGKPDAMKEVWKTASLYHLVHSAVLAASALSLAGRKRNIVCSMLAGGIFLFSGSCYVVVLMNQRAPYSYPAPFGGVLLMGGWLALGFLWYQWNGIECNWMAEVYDWELIGTYIWVDVCVLCIHM
jgi:uncharacterized membrane protein YgdD (TMEM256/DUF423 family)